MELIKLKLNICQAQKELIDEQMLREQKLQQLQVDQEAYDARIRELEEQISQKSYN